MNITTAWGRFTDWLLRLVDPSSEAWRQRREAMIDHPSKPTYDVYPEHDLPSQYECYVQARDARGRLLREYVNLEGYSLHQLNWKPDAKRGGILVRDWFVGQVLEALVDLAVRIDTVREQKEASDGQQTGPGTR